MTTIAYKDGMMAADTMMCLGDEKAFGAWKVFTTQKFLCGVAGSMSAIPALQGFLFEAEKDLAPFESAISLYRSWDTFPVMCEDSEALIVDKDGSIFHICGELPVAITYRKFAAIGTGAKLALGAMAYGASAKKAVEIATEFDLHSGGHVIGLPTEAIGGTHQACA